ncbi:hypothetical protein LTR62_002813 [Meristemomyces frigidus]|uniref:Purine nucleoside permease n=1 Tax=Meristemomyces frigidus TaxID=1508187 RepID=A0AAN7TPT9_9PEZI|nr:hypothetical protein LTR62_002813 [Meristemomyces frigidus]
MGEIHAASSAMALWLSDRFDLRSTYFLLAGIGGINPRLGTLGSVTFARYAVQLDLQYLVAESQVPPGFPTGFIPQKSHRPDEFPGILYGTEVFELNDKLRMKAMQLARHGVLNDTAAAAKKRAGYSYAPANKSPTVIACDTMTSNNWWSGSVLGEAFAGYVKLLTNGLAIPCTTQQEDNATLESLLRGAVAGRLDFGRIILMRTASDFAKAPPNKTEYDHLVNTELEGFVPALENVYIAGIGIVRDVLKCWDDSYAAGIKPRNHIGDLWDSLGNLPKLP